MISYTENKALSLFKRARDRKGLSYAFSRVMTVVCAVDLYEAVALIFAALEVPDVTVCGIAQCGAVKLYAIGSRFRRSEEQKIHTSCKRQPAVFQNRA